MIEMIKCNKKLTLEDYKKYVDEEMTNEDFIKDRMETWTLEDFENYFIGQ